eukprot:1160049-Pelagomonas_calceolata.AAC.4
MDTRTGTWSALMQLKGACCNAGKENKAPLLLTSAHQTGLFVRSKDRCVAQACSTQPLSANDLLKQLRTSQRVQQYYIIHRDSGHFKLQPASC